MPEFIQTLQPIGNARSLWLILAALLVAAVDVDADEIAEPPAPVEFECADAVIGEVFVRPENIFNVEDPAEDKSLFRFANKLHIHTLPRVIRQQLLFKSGDPYSQRLLDESERILRTDRYLYDASIRPLACRDGQVDVAVTTRDVWTLNPGVSFGRSGGKNTSGVELEELNILGTGTSLSVGRKSGVDRDSTLLEYRNPHVSGTWATLEGTYASNSDGSVHSLKFARPFYALDTRWASGVSVLDDDRIEPLYDLGQVVDQFRSHQKYASGFWGWSRGLRDGWAQRWSVGGTYDETVFGPAPPPATTTLVPADRKLVYPWLAYELIQDEFDKFQNHDQIGRTEDFFLGTRVKAQLGWASEAYGADRNALILSAKAGHGFSLSDDSTLLLDSALKGRMESGELRNTVLDAAARYYAKQSERRLFFTTLEASVGRALDLDTQITVGGDDGLRGYPLRYQSGDARALLTVEQRYFTDWYPFRLFRIGGAAFFDMGRTWGSTPVSTPSQGLLKDVGIGLRIANTRSGLGNIIHVDLAFPLDGDPSIDKVQLLIETKERF